MDLPGLQQLALAIMIDERRPLACLDDEVRQALGMRARRGRFRADDLACRLVQLIDSSEVWALRAKGARRRVVRTLFAGAVMRVRGVA